METVTVGGVGGIGLDGKMPDLLITLHNHETVAEIRLADKSADPLRLAWIRNINDVWEVWTGDPMPASRRHLHTVEPVESATDAKWRAIEWVRQHWRQIVEAEYPRLDTDAFEGGSPLPLP